MSTHQENVTPHTIHVTTAAVDPDEVRTFLDFVYQAVDIAAKHSDIVALKRSAFDVMGVRVGSTFDDGAHR